MLAILIIGSNQEGRLKKVEEHMGKKVNLLSNNPDFLHLFSPTSIGIEEIRNISNFLSLKPFQEKNKIVFIEEAQNLTIEAQNSLLKTLEEPPKNSLIFLSCPNESLLLPTIVSRCQVLRLTSEAQINLDNEEFKEFTNLLEKLLKSSAGGRIKLVEELGIYKDREIAILWLDKLTYVIRKLMLSKYLQQAEGTEGKLPSFFLDLSSHQFLHLLSKIQKTKKYLQANCNVRLTIEVFLSCLQGDALEA